MTRELVKNGVRSSTLTGEHDKSTFESEENSKWRFHKPANKRVKLSLDPNQQGDDFKSSNKQRMPIGLKLAITPSLINLVNTILLQQKLKFNTNSVSTRFSDVTKPLQHQSEKLKASNVTALLLIIGTYERSSVYEGDLVAKCYYAKKKLVWEVLEGAMKRKIEISWGDIDAIAANIQENKPGILEIELNQRPQIFKETEPQPRKHTLWHASSDFTGGQALICRRHRLEFPPRVLDKLYEKLLQCDQRLLELSRKPFPSTKCPYFHTKSCNSCNCMIPSNLPSCQPQLIPSPHSYRNLNLATNLPLQGTTYDAQGDEGWKTYIYDNHGEVDQSIYIVQEQIEGLQLLATDDPYVKHNSNISQFVPSDNNLSQVPPINSYINSSNTNMADNQWDYMRDNFGNDSLLLCKGENFDPDDGMIWPLHIINSVPAQFLSEDVTIVNDYPETFSDTSYFSQQWGKS